MKHYLLPLLLVIASSTALFSQNVAKLNTLDGGSFISTVTLNDTLYTISYSGDVYHSADNGANWQRDMRFNLGWETALKVTHSAFIKSDEYRNQLYVGGSFGLMIYKDGKVKNPSSIPEFFGSYGKLGDIVVSDSLLYASYRYNTASLGLIISSNDDGETWETHHDSNRFFSSLVAAPDGKVYGIDGGNIYLSDSSVLDFVDINLPFKIGNRITDAIVLANGQVIVTTNASGVLTSTDEGANWTTLLDENAYSVTELNDGSLLVGGINAEVFISSDTGANWTTIDLGFESSLFINQGINNIQELADGTLIGAVLWGDAYNDVYKNSSPGILSSTDGGQNWSVSNNSLEAHNIVQMYYDADEEKTYIYSRGAGVFVWNTNNETWDTVGNEGTPDLTSSISIPDADAGWGIAGENLRLSKNPSTGELWLVSKNYTIYLDAETNDWQVLEHDPYTFFKPKSLHFNTDGTAYAHESLGPFQGIYKSTDALTWTRLENTPAGSNITKFDYIDGYMLTLDTYAPDAGLGVYLSTDEGSSFEYLQEDREGYFKANDFYLDPVNKELVTLLTDYVDVFVETRVLSTGETTSLTFSSSEAINSPDAKKVVQLPNKSILLELHHTDETDYKNKFFGYYYKLEDSSTWTLLESDELPPVPADEIEVISTNEVLMKYGGEIYKVEIGDAVSISNELDQGFNPSTFKLHQNYPNPFNPTTKISFELNESSKTTVAIYSVLGKMVRTMELGNLSAGLHHATFDANGLPSGVYLYTVTAGNAKLSGKMTLLK